MAAAENNAAADDGYDEEHARVEAWLDEHPNFFQDYLIRKGRRATIDAWLVAHAMPSANFAAIPSAEHSK